MTDSATPAPDGATPAPDAAGPVPRASPAGVRWCTSVTVGVVSVAWDRIAGAAASPTGQGPRWRNVAVGVLFDAEDVAFGALSEFGRWAAHQGLRPVRRTGATVSGVTGRLSDLAERGAAETEHGRRVATSAATGLTQRVATNTVVNGMVDAQIDRIVRPLVAAVLDDVLALLENEPERVQSLIRSQRETITDEVVGRIRSSTAAGDIAVQGLVGRLLTRSRRPPARAAPETPEAPGTAGPEQTAGPAGTSVPTDTPGPTATPGPTETAPGTAGPAGPAETAGAADTAEGRA